MRTPCDEALLRSGKTDLPCAEAARPWILAATILGSSMAFIDSTVVNVALPTFQTTFHASVVDVQWVVESYGIFLSALILAGGALGDLFGRRRIFLIGVGVFALASIACGLSSSISQLITARSVQGVGAALLVPGSLAIISAGFDEESRGKAIGTWSGFSAITAALGPVLGGSLIALANGSAKAIQVSLVSGRESLHAASLCHTRNFPLLISDDPDPGAKVFGDGSGLRAAANDLVDVLFVAMVRRTGEALRRRNSAACRAVCCRCGFRPVCGLTRER